MDGASSHIAAADRNTTPASVPASSQEQEQEQEQDSSASSASSSASHPDRVFTPPLPAFSDDSHHHHRHRSNPNHTTVRHNGGNDHRADTDMADYSPAATAENINGASQLMLLSRIAEEAGSVADNAKAPTAASSRSSPDSASGGRKRTVDGAFKESSTSPPKRFAPAPPPVRPARGHLRSVSNVSMASTMSWTVPEAPAKLTATLKYAMQKVQRGWQDLGIDEVENLASRQAASRRASHRASTSSPTTTASTARPRPVEFAQPPPTPMLAPPVSIQRGANPPRSSNLHSVSALLNHDSPGSTGVGGGPHTPRHQTGGGHTRNSSLDPVFFSGNPQSHNVREQDAIASLISMSSPGNTASLKRHATFSPDSTAQSLAPPPPQIISFSQPTPSRVPLPESAPPQGRRPLPSQKPAVSHRHSYSASLAVGTRPSVMDRSPVGKSHQMMDLDSPSPAPAPASARKPLPLLRARANSGGGTTEKRPLSKPAGLGTGRMPRRKLSDREIEDMLEGVARAVPARDSDSDDGGEIVVPPRARIPLPA